MLNSRRSTLLSVAATALFSIAALPVAQASVITAWTFENNAAAVNNSPAPSTGSGTATSFGMDKYGTPNIGVTTDDVLLGATGDTGTNGAANLSQVWRVRAQAGPAGAVDLSFLPAANATLNALATVFLVAGWVAIKRRAVRVHKRLMVAAFAASTLFLVSYLTYHYVHGDTKYQSSK